MFLWSLALGIWSLRPRLLLFKFQRRRIDAVAQAGWLGPVLEHVPQVRLATAAHDFSSARKHCVVLLGLDCLL